VTLQLDGDERWNDRLACGGQMKVLIATWRPEDDLSFPRMLIDTIATGRAATEVIVVAANVGNTNEGDRWLIDETGQVLAFHGARAASASSCPSMLAEHLKPLHQRPRPYLAGGMSFIPHLKRCRLIIVGAGHVGQRVAELAADVDFDVWVLDDRADFCNADRFPRASRRIVDAFDTSLPALPVDAETYCVIVTRGHQQDQLALKHLAETGARYVGMIGSRRKIRLILDNLLAEGISREALDRVHAPLGLDIGSQTVPEIAISIVAELISDRNLGPK
jgi:xanthine dehydrogenase accessory factor